VHYRLVSQKEPILRPDGEPYENTLEASIFLSNAARDARYLDLIPAGAMIDRRNPPPMIFRPEEEASAAEVAAEEGYASTPQLASIELIWPRYEFTAPTIPQEYHVEIWCEKSTMNDVLFPLGKEMGVNVITGVGEMSLTQCELLVERALESGLPVRILYISDFDPGGQSMPVAVARKIEFLIRERGLDIQVRHVVLTHDQCIEYQLPRTPIKETERRAAKFEERFGEGATELDALEALYPGELRRLLEVEIERYLDPTLDGRVEEVVAQVERDIERIEDDVRRRHADAIAALQPMRDAHEAEIEQMRQRIAEMAEEEATAASSVLASMVSDLEAETPDMYDYDWPEPAAADEDPDPLFDSRRDYLDQLNRYHAHQGKPEGGVSVKTFERVCVMCGKAFVANRVQSKTCSVECSEGLARRSASRLPASKRQGSL
jgi:hypothetical protein